MLSAEVEDRCSTCDLLRRVVKRLEGGRVYPQTGPLVYVALHYGRNLLLGKQRQSQSKGERS